MYKYRYLFFLFLLFTHFSTCYAAPPDNGVQGKLIFLGVNHNSTQSVWLSLTTAAGSFKLEGPGNQLIDEWMKDQRGTQLSLSPIVSQGNGGTHHLINAANNKKLDSQNQSSDVVFPPFPSWQPGSPTHPIVIPPGSPGTPTNPIVIPPGSPGTPTNPIVIPPGSPEAPGTPTHPTVPSTSLPEGSGGNLGEGTTPEGDRKGKKAPITAARQLEEEENAWNVWGDNYYFGIRDDRTDVNTTGGATNFTVGADRRITNKLVAGVSLADVHLRTTAYNNALENNVSGYKVGPYFGFQLTQKWVIDGSINYGQFHNQNTIVSLNSRYITKLLNTSLHALGLYQFGNFQLRPQPLISYTYFRNPTYDFYGAIANRPIQITRATEHFSLGLAEFKVEGNYTQETKKGDLIQPFTELGLDYAFVRPSNDQVYSGNLALASVPKVSGLVTLGLRTVFAKKLLVQASGSYLSIGQQSYDLWNARVLISYSFC